MISNSKFFQALAQTQVIKWISFSEKPLTPAVSKNIKPSRLTASHPAENRKARVAENSPKP